MIIFLFFEETSKKKNLIIVRINLNREQFPKVDLEHKFSPPYSIITTEYNKENALSKHFFSYGCTLSTPRSIKYEISQIENAAQKGQIKKDDYYLVLIKIYRFLSEEYPEEISEYLKNEAKKYLIRD